jgi:hypothetical protein
VKEDKKPYTDAERKARNVHLSTNGYLIVFFILLGVSFLSFKYVPFPLGFLAGFGIIIYLFIQFPTLIVMWQKAEDSDPERKNDRLF